MQQAEVRLGTLVVVLSAQFRGRVVSWDSGWFIRSDTGELGGPWDARELTHWSQVATTVDGYRLLAELPGYRPDED